MQDAEVGSESYVLSWKTWPTIRQKLMSGMTLVDVTKWVRENETDAAERTDNAIIKVLSRMRNILRKTEAQSKMAELQGKVVELEDKPDGRPKTKGYIDVLGALTELFELQMERIKAGRTLEVQIKYLITKLTQDIGEAREILKFMFEVEQDLGLTHRKPPLLDDKYSKLTFEQRQKVGRMLEMIKEKVKQKGREEERIVEATTEVIEQEIGVDAIDVTPEHAVDVSGELPFE